jgi:hypothetical protein
MNAHKLCPPSAEKTRMYETQNVVLEDSASEGMRRDNWNRPSDISLRAASSAGGSRAGMGKSPARLRRNSRVALWLRKKALMALRALVWRVDEWIQQQEVQLREELGVRHGAARDRGDTERCSGKSASDTLEFRSVRDSAPERPAGEQQPCKVYPRRQPESFDAWTLRRAGVAPASKAEAKRHCERIRMNAAAFDRRFA